MSKGAGLFMRNLIRLRRYVATMSTVKPTSIQYTRSFFLSYLRAMEQTSSVDIRIDSSSCDFHNSSWDRSRSSSCMVCSFARLPVQQLLDAVNLGRYVS